MSGATPGLPASSRRRLDENLFLTVGFGHAPWGLVIRAWSARPGGQSYRAICKLRHVI